MILFLQLIYVNNGQIITTKRPIVIKNLAFLYYNIREKVYFCLKIV